MTSELPVKVGRGGAGNYYSHTGVEQANQGQQEDVEAQDLAASSPSVRSAPEFARSGRGGAGNLYSPQVLTENGVFNSTIATKRPSTNLESRIGGRGGAGNYRPKPEPVEDLPLGFSEAAVKDVEMGLRSPEKAHLGFGKG